MSAFRLALSLLISVLGTVALAYAQAEPPVSSAKAVAGAERRVALVIGNGAYPRAPLENPVNDANDIAAKLRNLGFEVVERANLKTSQIGRTLREFRTRIAPGSVALIFYAGHGLQIKGENYLPTIDADIEGEEDVPNQALSVRQMIELLDESKTRLNLVFLDACRNNPFSRKFRSVGDGLAKVAAPSGTLISFATRPGSVAADGEGRNGLYTAHLLKAMELVNQPIEQALKRVVSGVKQASKGQQEPWMEGSIEGDFYFLPQAVAASQPPAAEAVRSQQEAIDRAVQEAIRRSNEQAAKERAELQASMERMLQQALARQNEKLDEARKARDGVAAAAPAAAAPAASVPPTPAAVPAGQSIGSARPGDEWEYVAQDRFNKIRKILFRVKAVDPALGTLAEVLLNGKPVGEWVSDGKLSAIPVATDTEFVVSPIWDGKSVRPIDVVGTTLCSSAKCTLALKEPVGEKIAVPAGTFDAWRVDGYLNALGRVSALGGPFAFWFSKETGRLLRQSGQLNASGNAAHFSFQETIELQRVRTPGR